MTRALTGVRRSGSAVPALGGAGPGRRSVVLADVAPYGALSAVTPGDRDGGARPERGAQPRVA
ncbi:hypothetical protein SFR_6174 [Streptomyces sp. FR-008]|nr:hypothetical protein SFR_6174 [Streptomyces sp. FR-008]